MAIDRNVWRQNMEHTDKQHEFSGYTQAPNDILEALSRIRISGEENQCVWFILRKTYGWHKEEDWISNSQFVEGTGISRQNVNRVIKKLMQKGIVVKNDYKYRLSYSIQKDPKKWKMSSKQTTKIVVRNDSDCSQKQPSDVVNLEAHKRNYTKETITKENPSDFEEALGVKIEGVIKTMD